jgi:arsenite-transporting ATPase
MDLGFERSRHLFFTGKGGVGKTSVACATAIGLTDQGKRVLLVSTDPASNLDEVLQTPLGSRPTPIAAVSGLSALNIDPEAAAREYRRRIVEPYRNVLPDAALTSIEEQLSGACTVEIATFDEFSRLLGDPTTTTDFDHVVFDTAPTGHTLRLLQLPAAWSGFFDANTSGTSCLGPLAGLQQQRTLYAATLSALTDPGATAMILVSRPERSALAEAERTRGELTALGVTNQRLVVNGVFHATDPDDAIAQSLESHGREALSSIPAGIASLPRIEIPLLPFSLVGVATLRQLSRPHRAPPPLRAVSVAKRTANNFPQPLERLLDDIVKKQKRGVVMIMGKGGVGKTAIASAIAVRLAIEGHRVHLSTTDPAAHLDMSLASRVPNLAVSRIDPVTQTRRYTEEVMSTVGKNLDPQGRKLLEEDLRSPCTEEIALFRAFAEKVAAGGDGFVVLDTAPTGHTLLLLDASEAYHREVQRSQVDLPETVRELLPRLRDSDYSRVLLVTLPDATPVHEAARLQGDLERAGIEPYAWIVNQSLAPLQLRDPVLLSRQAGEARYIEEVSRNHTSRTALVPWVSELPDYLAWLGLLVSAGCDRGDLPETERVACL